MTRSILRLVKHAAKHGAWSLAAAGALGPSSATAQTSPYHPSNANKIAQRPWPTSMNERVARDVEIRVELAWLGTQVIFPYQLEARVVGSTLEVHGNVPAAGLHELALQIARQESAMRVVDKLQPGPGFYTPTSKPVHMVSREATQALRDALPREAQNIKVNVWMHGEVVLQGTVSSAEEKLTASRCMRRVVGCNSVINQLQVGTPIASRAAASDSKNAAGGEQLKAADLASVTMLRPESLGDDLIQPSALAHPDRDRDSPGISSAAPQVSSAGVMWMEKDSAAGADRQGAAPANFYQTKWRRMDGGKEVWLRHSATPAGQADSQMSRSGQTVASPYPRMGRPSGQPPIPLSQNKELGSNAGSELVQTSAQPSMPLSQDKESGISAGLGMIQTPEEPATRAGSEMVQSSVPPPTPPSESRDAVAARVNQAPARQMDAPKPQKQLAPIRAAIYSQLHKKPAPFESGSYATSGVMMIEESEPEAASAPAVASAARANLQQSIARACGKSEDEVEVTVVSEKSLQVRIKAPSAQEGDALWGKIARMPELAAYEVSLDVPVTR